MMTQVSTDKSPVLVCKNNLCMMSLTGLVQEIIAYGKRYDGVAVFGNTYFHEQPIHRGIASQSIAITEALLEFGASPSDRTRRGCSGLMYAALYGTPEMFAVLLRACSSNTEVSECLGMEGLLFCGFESKSLLTNIFRYEDEYMPYHSHYFDDDYRFLTWFVAKYEDRRTANLWTLLTLVPNELPLLLEDIAAGKHDFARFPRMLEFVYQHARWSSEPRLAWIRAVLRL